MKGMVKCVNKMQLRVATWNIGSLLGFACDDAWYLRYQAALETLSELNLDVLCVQELPGNMDAVFRFSRDLDLPFYVFKELSVGSKGSDVTGIGVFSRFPIELLDEHVMHNPCYQFPHRSALGALGTMRPERTHDKAFICTNVAGVVVITGHALPLHRYGIDPQVLGDSYKRLADWIVGKAEGSFPVVVAGDFNLANLDAVMPALPIVFTSAVEGATRPESEVQHDYIFASSFMDAQETRIVEAYSKSAGGKGPLFDHRMVFAEFFFEGDNLAKHREAFVAAYRDELSSAGLL